MLTFSKGRVRSRVRISATAARDPTSRPDRRLPTPRVCNALQVWSIKWALKSNHQFILIAIPGSISDAGATRCDCGAGYLFVAAASDGAAYCKECPLGGEVALIISYDGPMCCSCAQGQVPMKMRHNSLVCRAILLLAIIPPLANPIACLVLLVWACHNKSLCQELNLLIVNRVSHVIGCRCACVCN